MVGIFETVVWMLGTKVSIQMLIKRPHLRPPRASRGHSALSTAEFLNLLPAVTL